MLAVNIILFGTILGLLFSLWKKSVARSIIYILIGMAGAFLGAFLGFGDAPFMMQNPIFNTMVLLLLGSLILLTVVMLIDKKITKK